MKQRLESFINLILAKFGIKREGQGIGAVIKNFTWLLFDRVFAIFFTLVVTVLLTRILGPEKFGIISYGQSIYIMLSALCRLGLDNVVVRELVVDKTSNGDILGTSFFLKLISGFVCLCLVITGILVLSSEEITSSANLVTIILCGGLLFQPFGVVDLFFQSETKSKFVAISKTLAISLSSLGKLLLVYLNYSIVIIALAFLAEFVLLGLFLLIIYGKKSTLKLKSWRWNTNLAKSLLKSSWLLVLSAISVTIYLKVDIIMIKHYLGDADVGEYAAAVQLSEGWNFIPQIIVISIFPSIINIRNESIAVYRERLQSLMNFMVIISLLIAIPITIFSDFIVLALFGSEYVSTASVLSVHIWSSIFVFIGFVSGRWLIIEKMEMEAFKRSMAGAVINVILNIFLIPLFGIVGAAVSTFLSVATSMYIFFYFDKKTKLVFEMATNALSLNFLTKKVFKK